MPDADTIRTADLAHEAGVSRQTIAKWQREGLGAAAKIAHGKWNREAALSWIADRREDSLHLTGTGDEAASLTKARIKLYTAQTAGAEIRNELAMGTLVYRDRATDAFAQVASAQIAAGDSWARDHRTPACEPLEKHVSAAVILAMKAELWNELRGLQSRSVERVAGALATGEDVAPTRIHVARRMGR